MKTPNKLLSLTSASLLLIFAGLNVAGAETGTARGGAGDLFKRSKPSEAKQAVAPAPADKSHYVCPDCKTIKTTQLIADGKRHLTRVVPIEKHLCGACKTTIEKRGHGKAAHNTVVHLCKAAGAQAASCCPK